jgi:hypothetical protein
MLLMANLINIYSLLSFSICRSPDIEPGARVTSGGWGLGAGNIENSKGAEDEEEDEPLDWDQAQVRVEIIPNKKPYVYAFGWFNRQL